MKSTRQCALLSVECIITNISIAMILFVELEYETDMLAKASMFGCCLDVYFTLVCVLVVG